MGAGLTFDINTGWYALVLCRNRVILRAASSQEPTMPVYSMTGYASAQHRNTAATGENTNATAPFQIGMELRSVNSRFLDISFKLADELRPFEPGCANCWWPGSNAASSNCVPRSSTPAPARFPTRSRGIAALGTVQDQIMAWMPSAPDRRWPTSCGCASQSMHLQRKIWLRSPLALAGVGFAWAAGRERA